MQRSGPMCSKAMIRARIVAFSASQSSPSPLARNEKNHIDSVARRVICFVLKTATQLCVDDSTIRLGGGMSNVCAGAQNCAMIAPNLLSLPVPIGWQRRGEIK